MRTPALLVFALAAYFHAASSIRSFLKDGRANINAACVADPRKKTSIDEVAYAMMTERICKINWVLSAQTDMSWGDVQNLGCWRLMTFNTERYMSSGVYQNQIDGRCTLVFSGYHGKLTGPIEAIRDTWRMPGKKVNICGNTVYEPFVRIMRRHMALSSWSNIAKFLAGPRSNCSDITITAESMGGSGAEILAACANSGNLTGLQNSSLPVFQVQKLFTFGAVANSIKPIENPLSKDGCFPGTRVWINGDMFSDLGGMGGFQHARMDAMEIFHTKNGVSRRTYPCLSKDAVHDYMHKPPPASEAIPVLTRKSDITKHEIMSYERDLELIFNNQLGGSGQA